MIRREAAEVPLDVDAATDIGHVSPDHRVAHYDLGRAARRAHGHRLSVDPTPRPALSVHHIRSVVFDHGIGDLIARAVVVQPSTPVGDVAVNVATLEQHTHVVLDVHASTLGRRG